MKQDRFLMFILGGIGILVILAVVLFFARQQPQEYGADTTPDGVVRNYILALQKEDYQRAYGYLQDADEKPTYTAFQQILVGSGMEIAQSGIQIGEINIIENEATVPLTIIHNTNAPFNRGWEENTSALLKQENGEWKIVTMPYPFWGWDWYIAK